MFWFPFVLFTISASASLQLEQTSLRLKREFSYISAVDFVGSFDTSTFSCLKSGGFPDAVVRVYKSDGMGSFDNSSFKNMEWAYFGGVSTDNFMTPQPKGNKTGGDEVYEMYWGLSNLGAVMRSFWLKVVNPSLWYADSTKNIAFIQSVFLRSQQIGLNVGIYTSSSEWSQITGNWKGASNASLWYKGTSASPDFSDFRAFGGWTFAVGKQYATAVNMCQVTVNQNVFLTA